MNVCREFEQSVLQTLNLVFHADIVRIHRPPTSLTANYLDSEPNGKKRGPKLDTAVARNGKAFRCDMQCRGFQTDEPDKFRVMLSPIKVVCTSQSSVHKKR